MKILTCASDDDSLERYRPAEPCEWQLVGSGFWSDDIYHSGHIAYFLAKTQSGEWVMECVTRNAELDGLTEEDVEAGALNDDQLQALWEGSLEEAQNERQRTIVAVGLDAGAETSAQNVARALYDAVVEAGGAGIEEQDGDGLLF